jgi:hypothetical protein
MKRAKNFLKYRRAANVLGRSGVERDYLELPRLITGIPCVNRAPFAELQRNDFKHAFSHCRECLAPRNMVRA